MHGDRLLAVSGSQAIRAGVAAADDHYALSRRQNLARNDVTLAHAILLRQVIHREMNALEIASGDGEIARLAVNLAVGLTDLGRREEALKSLERAIDALSISAWRSGTRRSSRPQTTSVSAVIWSNEPITIPRFVESSYNAVTSLPVKSAVRIRAALYRTHISLSKGTNKARCSPFPLNETSPATSGAI